MLTLKNKILWVTPVLLVGIMFIAMIIVSLVINRQSQEAADRLLQNTISVIRNTVLESEQLLYPNARQMAKVNDMGSKIKYLVDSKPYFKYDIMRPTYISIATTLYDIGITSKIWKSAIYDLEGILIAFCIIEENGSIISYQHDQNIIEMTSLGRGQELSPELWRMSMVLPEVGIKFDSNMLNRSGVNFAIIDNKLCLSAHVPILAKDYNSQTGKMELRPVGQLVAIQKFGDEFVNKVSKLTGTDINIFGPSGLISGTRKEYGNFDFKLYPDRAYEMSLSEQPVGFNGIVLGGKGFFQAVIPIYDYFKCVAVVAALYPKSIGKTYTDQVIKLLALVYFFCIILILPLVIIFFIREVVNPIKKTVFMMREITDKKDFNQMLKVKSGDEMGQLATAFNIMTKELKNSTTSIDALNKEIENRNKLEDELKKAYEQLKKTQNQLVQSAKMASVGLLAGGVAHEINNPLTGVLNNAQLIRMIAGQGGGEMKYEQFKDLLTIIEESALRCKKITQSLLDFSHTSKGNFNNISINDVIDKVLVLIAHELSLQNIVIRKDLENNLPFILGDIQLLQQVVFDMISNAAWAIKKRMDKEMGVITFKTRYSPNKLVVLNISDNGIGISKENQASIFEPFFTTKPVGEGTGLGLSIVYNIIQAHKGTIELESEPGKGTIFTLSFPSSSADA